jgi:hypothetical protein
VGRVKINGLFFLKVRGFFDNDKGNLHYQTKPGKQLRLLSFSSESQSTEKLVLSHT